MPSNDTLSTLGRQWEILKCLPSGGRGKTVAEIAQELGELGYQVSTRSIQRDLQALSGLFPALECNDRGRPYGWRWARNTSLGIPGMSISDALSLHFIQETLKPLLPKSILDSMQGQFEGAAARLDRERGKNDLADWSRKVCTVHPTQPVLPPNVDAEVMSEVYDALLHGQQLEVEYRSLKGNEPETRVLHPLGLVQRGPVSYLLATAFDYEDIRIWALHRMSRARRTYEESRVPEGFDLAEYLRGDHMHFGSQGDIELKARLHGELPRILAETPLSRDQRLRFTDGACYLAATVSLTWQLRWWLLSQGSDVEVIAPSSLREEIVARLRAAVKRYA